MEFSEIQYSLPWQSSSEDPDTSPYSKDFHDDRRGHKDFEHALIHVLKAAGKLATVVDNLDHGRVVPEYGSEQVANYLEDIVIACMRMANTGTKYIFRPVCDNSPLYLSQPGDEHRVLNLEAAVVMRVLSKNDVKLMTDGTGRMFFVPKEVLDEEPGLEATEVDISDLWPKLR
jgi:hypothetical protein